MGSDDGFAAARSDLDHLLDVLDTTHPNAWHGISREDWVARLDELKADLPQLDRFQAQVELQKLVGLLSRVGRDGHQFAIPAEGAEGPMLPIRVYEFFEGVFVTAAMDGYEDLVGKEILTINGHPVEEVLAAIEPIVPRDGPATVPGFRPIFFTRTSVLRGLGLVDVDGPVPMELAPRRAPITAELEPVPFDEWFEWAGGHGANLPLREDTLYLSRSSPDLWWERIDGGATLYVRYLRVTPLTGLNGLSAEIDAGDFDQIVLDLRQNPGGDNHNFPPLVELLDTYDADNPGSLYVVIDRLTFSAASNFATSIEQRTGATFLGEPMGGGLNFWNDVDFVQLPYYPVPMQVGVSTRYWEFAEPDDPRLTIEPAFVQEVTANGYFMDVDPVLAPLPAN